MFPGLRRTGQHQRRVAARKQQRVPGSASERVYARRSLSAIRLKAHGNAGKTGSHADWGGFCGFLPKLPVRGTGNSRHGQSGGASD